MVLRVYESQVGLDEVEVLGEEISENMLAERWDGLVVSPPRAWAGTGMSRRETAGIPAVFLPVAARVRRSIRQDCVSRAVRMLQPGPGLQLDPGRP